MAKATKASKGLSKRCTCPKRNWSECDHPYHFEWFYSKNATQYTNRGKHRYSLDAVAQARGIEAPRSRDAAQSLAEAIRIEIRAGRFLPPRGAALLRAIDPSALTVNDIAALYTTQHIKIPTRRKSSQQAMRLALAVLLRTTIPGAGGVLLPFGQKPMRDVVRADIEALRSARRAVQGGRTRKAGEVGINRLLERCRHLLSWSVEHGYREDTPFSKNGIAFIKLTPETNRKRRLLDANEEATLLAAAPPHLKDLIVAATNSGCRLGELLSLQWKHIRVTTTATGQTRQAFVLKAENTKTDRERVVPVSARLATVLTMRRHAPDGTEHGPNAYVFGNAVGERVKSIKKSWMTCVLRAYGFVPTWVKGGKNQLSAESRAQYAEIDLHFHDLRREFGSRILEAGGTIVDAQYLLGHSDPSQTATYLNVTEKGLQSAIDKLDAHTALPEPPLDTTAATPPPVLTPPSSDTIQ